MEKLQLNLCLVNDVVILTTVSQQFPTIVSHPPNKSLLTVTHQHLPYPPQPKTPFGGLPVFETTHQSLVAH